MEEFKQIIWHIQQTKTAVLSHINSELINLYWQVGQYIHHKLLLSQWGDKTIITLSDYIRNQHPELKGFEKRNLYRMIQFYRTYIESQMVPSLPTQLKHAENEPNLIVPSVMTQINELQLTDIRQTDLCKLSWTHHCTLMSRCKNQDELFFYLKTAIKESYTVRQLERQMNSALFERTMEGKLSLSPAMKELGNENNFKDQYVFEFLNLKPDYKERDLQQALVTQMKAFIQELGSDYLFVSQEFKLMVGNSDFYIDLLFYHRELRCLIAFELKADKFRPEHLGQLNFYLEALDRDVKKMHENPSIGILLCKDKDNEVVEYALSRSLSPTMVAQYRLTLPDKKQFQHKLHVLFEQAGELTTNDN